MKAMPVVPGYPLLGVIPHLNGDALKFLTETRARYGDVVKMRVGNRVAVMVSDPRIIEHILVDNVRNYSKQTRGYHVLRKLVGNGLLTSEGSFWLRQRRIAQPAFHRERVGEFAAVMKRDAVEAIERWPRGVPFDVANEMMKLTMRIAGETLLSSDVTAEASQIGDALKELLQQAMKRTRALLPIPEAVPTPMNIRFHRAKRVLDNAILRIIEERRKGVDKPDLLSMLMHAVDEETGERMSDAQLKDEAMTLFIAGHETTANNLAWTLYLLATHPVVEARLREEIVAGDDLMRLPYLDAVLKESLRLFPPAWILARFCESDEVIAGHQFHRGEFIFMSSYVVHRHPRLWEDADRFVPERWLDEPEPAQKYSYFPFSGGARKCIGDIFATMEAKIVLVEILKRVRLELAPGARVTPEPVVTLRPRFGMQMVARSDA